jgi:hypothetical protein
LGRIINNNKKGEILSFRPTLFDRYEERDNLLSESTLEFLNIGLSKFGNNIKLYNFDIIKMESLNKRFDFYSPTSWRLYAGANRSLANEDLETVLEIGLGITKGNQFISIYGMGQVALYPFQMSVNLQSLLGISLWIDKFHFNFDYKKNFIGSTKSKDNSQFTFYYPFNKSLSFRFSNDFKNKEKIASFEYKF